MDKIKNIFITATIGFILVTLLNSCHKYPEDPFISLRSPYKRLMGDINGPGTTWKFSSYQKFGVEHSHDFDGLLTPHTLTDCKIYFDYKENYFGISVGELVGSYYLSGDRKAITFVSRSADSVGNIFYLNILNNNIPNLHSPSTNWKIVELYGKNFHISNNGIDIYFKEQ